MTPSHASASRKGGGEALTGGVQAGLLGTSEGDRHLLMKGWPLVERDRQLFKLQKVVSP
jgi:hypothetical protein